jgi:transcriptional regulator with XRE-family HTH domain
MIKINKNDKSEPFKGWKPLGFNAVILARQSRGLSQSQLAKRVGTNQSVIATLENGYGCPSADLIRAIAQATNYPNKFFTINEYIFPALSLHKRIDYI